MGGRAIDTWYVPTSRSVEPEVQRRTQPIRFWKSASIISPGNGTRSLQKPAGCHIGGSLDGNSVASLKFAGSRVWAGEPVPRIICLTPASCRNDAYGMSHVRTMIGHNGNVVFSRAMCQCDIVRNNTFVYTIGDALILEPAEEILLSTKISGALRIRAGDSRQQSWYLWASQFECPDECAAAPHVPPGPAETIWVASSDAEASLPLGDTETLRCYTRSGGSSADLPALSADFTRAGNIDCGAIAIGPLEVRRFAESAAESTRCVSV